MVYCVTAFYYNDAIINLLLAYHHLFSPIINHNFTVNSIKSDMTYSSTGHIADSAYMFLSMHKFYQYH